jgi:hypothetical protein
MSPAQRSVAFVGGAGSVQVTSSAATCSWTPASSAAWLTITSGPTLVGSGEIRYVALPNLAFTQREATITVGTATHRVIQAALPNGNVEFSGAVSGLSGSCPTIRFTLEGITITTNNGTEFRRGSCQNVQNGGRVQVDGMFQSDGTLLARRVELDR